MNAACAAATALVLVISLSGCAAYQRQEACDKQLGPPPGMAWAALGLVGGLIQASQPSYQEWSKANDRCMGRTP